MALRKWCGVVAGGVEGLQILPRQTKSTATGAAGEMAWVLAMAHCFDQVMVEEQLG